jgi:hypothetical protein
MSDASHSKTEKPAWSARGKKDAAASKCDPRVHASAYRQHHESHVPRHTAQKVIEQAFADGVQKGVEKVLREGLRDVLQELIVKIQRAWEQERFARLAAEWKKDTFLLSKVRDKVIHIAYQKIIGMGLAAVPCILKDLRDNGPNHWFWALHAITEENPVAANKVGNIAAMTEAWLQWGKQKGYLNDSQTTTKDRSRT